MGKHRKALEKLFGEKFSGKLEHFRERLSDDRYNKNRLADEQEQHLNDRQLLRTRVDQPPILGGQVLRGPYRQASGAPHGGEDFIVVEGDPLSAIMWAQAGGKKYVDLKGAPCRIVGPPSEIAAFVKDVSENYLVNGNWMHYSTKLTPEMQIFVEVETFVPMSYTKRHKVYNTNYMVAKQGMQSAMAAAGVAAGAVNPRGALGVALVQTGGDVIGADESFESDGGIGEIKEIETDTPLYAIVFSAVSQGKGEAVQLTSYINIGKEFKGVRIALSSRDVCKRTFESIVAKSDRRQVSRAVSGPFSEDGWWRFMSQEMERKHPGWLDGELGTYGMVKGVESQVRATFEETIEKIRKAHAKGRNADILILDNGLDPKRTEQAYGLDGEPGDPRILPAVKIGDMLGTIGPLLAGK